MAEPPLRVLVPRPARDNDHFLRLLGELDVQGRAVQALNWPVMAIEPRLTDQQAQQHFLDRLASSDIVIFVSAPAVEMVLRTVGAAPLAGRRLLSVGRSTAALLSVAGLAVDYPDNATTEGLLALSVLHKVDEHSRILICRGEGGRETLAESLSARGASVQYAEVYSRVQECSCRDQICSALHQGEVDAVFIHSGAVFHHFVALLDAPSKTLMTRLPLIVPGARVANVVRRGGAENVTVAKNALPENMVAGLVHWYTREKQKTGN